MEPKAVAPTDNNEQLAYYRHWFEEAAGVCERAARGDLEPRMLHLPEAGEAARLGHAINQMLDMTDAFVRESRASLDYAAHGKFFRRVLLRGMQGSFRHASGVINAATDEMARQAAALKDSERQRRELAGELDQIIATLDITCPTGGCDPWDRVSGVEVKGHNGEWYEVIRYITPYGVACGHSVDLTDFMSILQGKIAFRFYLGTQGNGFEYTLNLSYKAGVPEDAYSSITKLWYKTYNFGDPGNLQPCEVFNAEFPDNTQAAKIKLVSTGHGWGDNNTGNAAEFHHDIHHVHINGAETFAQDNWQDCNPNPQGCQPQNGTWFYDRAGWCPGLIAPWFDFDMTPYIGDGSAEYKYIFNEAYVDICHPNNPDCVSGIHCANCDDGFNPHLIVASYLINLGDTPLEETGVGIYDPKQQELSFRVYPNPSTGIFQLSWDDLSKEVTIQVSNNLGQTLKTLHLQSHAVSYDLDLQGLPRGIYFIQVNTENGKGVRKVVKE